MTVALELLQKLEALETTEEVRSVVSAALTDHLDDLLAGRPVPDAVSPDPDEGYREAAGAYLSRIAAAGFRGIGPEAAIELGPGPGLTLVVGRNGSGKSSFAEAAEYALTGENSRWVRRSAVVRDGWRNLHHTDTAAVRVGLQFDHDADDVSVERHWEGAGSLDSHTLTVSHPVRGATSLEALGIVAGLATYRPFLPYNELGAIADEGPTQLHDTLQQVLGLDSATEAADRIRQARLDREKAWKAVRAEAKELATHLEDVEDDRAARVADQLTRGTPNLSAIENTIGTDAGESDPGLALLRQLAQLTPADLDVVRADATELSEAADAVAELADTDAHEKSRLADLLAAALDHHERHDAGPCPVCGEGRLDDAWRTSTLTAVAELRSAARVIETATNRATQARRAALRHATAPPDALRKCASVGIDAEGVLRAYEQLEVVHRIDDDRMLADTLLERVEDVSAGVENIADVAATRAREREDAWRPHVGAVAAWLERARPAADGQEQVAVLQAAEKACKDATAQLREERWAPIAARAKHHWETLRNQSNVEISEVVLAGTATKRHVAIDVKIDGVDGAALGVMSQGELHALALALFLPRATMEESPFRFVVIDDPVQSMDPARVDGLARVLEEVAIDRQVIVLTHDDRLAEAVRRLQIEATVFEVARAARSRVEVRRAMTPARRYLDDARALALTPDLPALVATRTVAGFCRLALEAAATDEARRSLHAAGVAHAEIDERLERATKLLPRLALAFFQNESAAGEVHGHVKQMLSHRHASAILVCNEGSHDGHAVDDLRALVNDVQELTGALKS